MKSPFLDAMRRATDATREFQEAFSGGVTINTGTSDPVTSGNEGIPMLSQTYSGAAGARDYRLFLPPQAPDGLRGLIVMLHGCSQTPDDFARGTAMNDIAAREGLVVAYPEQTSSHNAHGCWNWFEPAHQRHGEGEPAILAGLAREVAQTHGVPEEAVFAAGLSAGGAMAAVLGATYPEVFSAIGVHSGLGAGAAQDVSSAFAVMGGHGAAGAVSVDPAPGQSRVMIVHGHRDKTVVPANGVRLFEAMTAAHPQAIPHRDPVGQGTPARQRLVLPDGTVIAEHWQIADLGHAWSGGSSAGSFTEPHQPDASQGFVRFFLNPKV